MGEAKILIFTANEYQTQILFFSLLNFKLFRSESALKRPYQSTPIFNMSQLQSLSELKVLCVGFGRI